MSGYPSRRGPLAIELASTIFAQDGQLRDGLATSEDLAAWLRTNARHFPEPERAAAASQLAGFRALRSAVCELLGAAIDGNPPPAPAVGLLNDLSGAAPQWIRLDWIDDAPHRTAVEVVADPATVALAIVARASIEMLSSTDRERLGVCHAPGCVLFFLKERGRREWCSAQCGNRARVARHYQRHRLAHIPDKKKL
jgi:predicted RNA-binding Zn ribbon-like protein